MMHEEVHDLEDTASMYPAAAGQQSGMHVVMAAALGQELRKSCSHCSARQFLCFLQPAGLNVSWQNNYVSAHWLHTNEASNSTTQVLLLQLPLDQACLMPGPTSALYMPTSKLFETKACLGQNLVAATRTPDSCDPLSRQAWL